MKSKLLVYSATRGNVDGTDYSSVWAESEETVNTADTVGKPPMKINCEKSVIDQLHSKAPCVCIVDTKMISAGGAKGGLFIKSIEFENSPGIPGAQK